MLLCERFWKKRQRGVVGGIGGIGMVGVIRIIGVRRGGFKIRSKGATGAKMAFA